MTLPSPRLTIVIPVRNGWARTQALLTALRTEIAGRDVEVVVVDDGSSDATARELARATGIVTERLATPGGLAQAAARGARRATSGLVAFLGNGTAPDGRWLGPLLARLDSVPGLAAVGPQRLGPQGELLAANVAMTWAALAGECLPQADPPPLALSLDGLVVRVDALARMGGLGGGYRDHWAEVDLCLRLSEAGLHIAQVRESVLPVVSSWGVDLPNEPGDEELMREAWRSRVGPPPPWQPAGERLPGWWRARSVPGGGQGEHGDG